MAGTVTASVIKNDTTSPPAFQNSAGTEVGQLARAWVNFNGTTSPGTIRASFNVSSVTKNATGDYTVNFTNALPDANFAAAFGASPQNGRWLTNWNGVYNNGTTAITNTTTTIRIAMIENTGALVDPTNAYVAVFR